MPNNIEEIKKALTIIRDVCEHNKSSCVCCPLCYDNTCGITGDGIYGQIDYRKKPMYWNIPSQIKLMRKVDH